VPRPTFESVIALESYEINHAPKPLVYRKKGTQLIIDSDCTPEESIRIIEQKRKVDEFEKKWTLWPDGTSRRVFRPFKSVTEFEALLEPNLLAMGMTSPAQA
jgi:hypothetical protein